MHNASLSIPPLNRRDTSKVLDSTQPQKRGLPHNLDILSTASTSAMMPHQRVLESKAFNIARMHSRFAGRLG